MDKYKECHSVDFTFSTNQNLDSEVSRATIGLRTNLPHEVVKHPMPILIWLGVPNDTFITLYTVDATEYVTAQIDATFHEGRGEMDSDTLTIMSVL